MIYSNRQPHQPLPRWTCSTSTESLQPIRWRLFSDRSRSASASSSSSLASTASFLSSSSSSAICPSLGPHAGHNTLASNSISTLLNIVGCMSCCTLCRRLLKCTFSTMHWRAETWSACATSHSSVLQSMSIVQCGDYNTVCCYSLTQCTVL